MTRRIIALAAVMTLAGCALDKQGAPPLAGPSELGLSLTITASPDVITQDGVSQSVIQVLARNADSLPVPGLGLRVATLVGDLPVDFGVLSSKALATGGDGRAVVTYTAPPPPPSSSGGDPVVTIQITPVDSNYANTVSREVLIRLAKPGVILPPNGTPNPRFIVSPTTPREGDRVNFDGSRSFDDGQIVAWDWTFGDGDSATGMIVSNRYELAGVYTASLTVTDDRGLKATSPGVAVTVTSADAPTAAFSLSPSSPVPGETVFFNGTLSTATNGRQIVAYDWDFGDGSFAAGPTVSHAYASEGTYVIVLKVTDDNGKVHAVSASVSVMP